MLRLTSLRFTSSFDAETLLNIQWFRLAMPSADLPIKRVNQSNCSSRDRVFPVSVWQTSVRSGGVAQGQTTCGCQARKLDWGAARSLTKYVHKKIVQCDQEVTRCVDHPNWKTRTPRYRCVNDCQRYRNAPIGTRKHDINARIPGGIVIRPVSPQPQARPSLHV